MSIARLRALRLVGFKSFAEKTVVEFGPGISAVVGPNGSGKSNLADALRWALGEQGRSLRTRKSEDVIFAGSARRHGTGMADVTLVIDNGDRLLPLDYAEVELGRRLYRSGENEYLVNRQRVRLKDLVELLDAANLADNAFLFIGQGMVDQALALRPEERRPLFEEVAGVRRHERRRRQAETELAEAEANLERVRDIVAELRPQARRLAIQAEQQAARDTAGHDLAAALVASGGARWSSAEGAAAEAGERLAGARAAGETMMAALRAAETELATVTEALVDRAERERRRRAALDEVRSRSLEARLVEARARTELEALNRDRARLIEERDAATARAEAGRRDLAVGSPAGHDGAELDRDELDQRAELEEALATAVSTLREARSVRLAEGERAAAARRAVEARTAELERSRRRTADLERRAAEQRLTAEQAAKAAAAATSVRDAAVATALDATAEESRADGAAATARAAHEAAEDRRREIGSRVAALDGQLAVIRARLESLEAALESADRERLYTSARRRGGRRLLEGVEVDRSLGLAVEVALGDAARGVVVEEGAIVALRNEQGLLLLAEARRATTGGTPAQATRATDAARAAGGGPLGEALRRDPDGVVGRLLAGVLWTPDLDGALAVRPSLPFGWCVATATGQLVGEDGIVRLGGHDALFERRAELDRLTVEQASVEAERSAAADDAAAATGSVTTTARALADARRALEAARRHQRLAAEDERHAVRAAEAAEREGQWQAAQAERLEQELGRAREALAAMAPADGLWGPTREPAAGPPSTARSGSGSASTSQPSAAAQPTAIGQLEGQVEQLRSRRDAVIAEAVRRREERDRILDQRRRAEVALTMDEARSAELDARIRRLITTETDAETTLAALASQLAGSVAAEEAARAELDRALADSGAARARSHGLERAAADAREALRAAEGHSRDAEVAEMEARLGLENAREALLVELAGIGAPGLEALQAEAPKATARPAAGGGVVREGPAETPSAEGRPGHVDATADEATELDEEREGDVLADELEAALDAAAAAWRVAALSGAGPAAPPAASRLATLRRRFHELGATNPFAATEYHEVSERLGTLEAQRADLERAIAATRQLIEDLAALVATRFRETFAALEGAFGRRFQQLFDGGDAQLVLTMPDDLSVTGIEISARPPGKKRQALAMLSGGERALTAVALLFAMLEVRPVPFCVLDEVDAALDEANVGRFGGALRGLAQHIQFVVITHNRATIEAADALYGVTVGDDAVSRVISLRMADVSAGEVDPRTLVDDAGRADGPGEGNGTDHGSDGSGSS